MFRRSVRWHVITTTMASADDEDYFVDDEDTIKFITFPEEVEKAIEQVNIRSFLLALFPTASLIST